MYKVHLVGCGSLGSLISIELAKRAAALKFPIDIHIYDYDKVEDRNLYSQDFYPAHLGEYKSDVIAKLISQFNGVTATSHVVKVDSENITELIPNSSNTIIIDAVDNLKARQLLWQHSYLVDIPVVHSGMSTQGSGLVSWNYKAWDAFPLSPAQLSADKQKEIEETVEEKLPPCMLNSFRSLIVNTSLATVNAVFICFGNDSTKEFVDPEEPTKALNLRGIASHWHTDPYSMKNNIALHTFFSDWE